MSRLAEFSMLFVLMAAHAALTQATAEDCISSADGVSCEAQFETSSLLQTKVNKSLSLVGKSQKEDDATAKKTDVAGCEDESPVSGDKWAGLSMGCQSESCSVTAKTGPQVTVNGCGAEGGANFQSLTGDSHAMVAACNFHDTCYCRCTDPTLHGGVPFGQKECDEIFLKMMLQICHEKPVWREEACYRTAYTFYYGLRAKGHEAYKSAVEHCCTCSSNAPTVDPKWNTYLKEDMTTRDPTEYEAVRSDIDAIVDNTDAFNSYLVPTITSWLGCNCVSDCGRGLNLFDWCYTGWGCRHSWDYCTPV